MSSDVLAMSSDEEEPCLKVARTAEKKGLGKGKKSLKFTPANSRVTREVKSQVASTSKGRKRKQNRRDLDDADNDAPLTKKDVPGIVKAVLDSLSVRRSSSLSEEESDIEYIPEGSESPSEEDLPREDELRHVKTLEDLGVNDDQRSPKSFPPRITNAGSVLFGTSYPPVPNKLIKKITDGEFVEMADLLPDKLAALGDNELTKPAKKRRIVTNILEWVRCFGLYISIISQSTPTRVPDLLGYQALIIDAYTEYKGDYWSGYDRQFRQRAAVTLVSSWSTMDTTLWNQAFGGLASLPRCTHCFSVSHTSRECELAPDTPMPSTSGTYVPAASGTRGPSTSGTPASGRSTFQNQRPICFLYNEDPGPGCPRCVCKFEHSCYLCRKDNVPNKNHKAIHCPHHVLDRPMRPQRPTAYR